MALEQGKTRQLANGVLVVFQNRDLHGVVSIVGTVTAKRSG
jgi:hypothetical protein